MRPAALTGDAALSSSCLDFSRVAGPHWWRMGEVGLPWGQMIKPQFTRGSDLAKVTWQVRGRVRMGIQISVQHPFSALHLSSCLRSALQLGVKAQTFPLAQCLSQTHTGSPSPLNLYYQGEMGYCVEWQLLQVQWEKQVLWGETVLGFESQLCHLVAMNPMQWYRMEMANYIVYV